MKSDDDKRMHFSREVRLGEVITALVIVVGGVAAWGKTDNRIATLEENQREQKATNVDLRQSIREVGNDVKDLSGSVRRIEGQMRANRGREG